MLKFKRNCTKYLVQLNDGSIIPLKQFTDMVPQVFVVGSWIHMSLAKSIADGRNYSQFESKVYANLLALKSLKCRHLSAVLYFNKYSKSENPVVKIFYHQLPSTVPSLFKEFGITIETNSNQEPFLDKKKVFFIIKYLVNFIFKALKFPIGRQKHSNSIIRSWVEVSESLFSEHFKNSHILIYPFGIKPIRQIKYVINCIKKGYSFQFAGINYKIKDLLRLVFSSDYDNSLVQFELNGYKSHSRWLKSLRPKIIYTSDDFEVASFACHEALMKNSVRIINSAHGIGFYCINIAYSTFQVFNEAQKEYYKTLNSSIDYVIKKESPELIKINSKDNLSIIYIYSGMEKKSFYYKNLFNYEIEIEDGLMRRLKEIASENEIDFLIKIHPNSSKKTVRELQKDYGVKVLYTIPDAIGQSIFVNLYSTAYFEFAKFGPVLFVKNDLLKPEIYFGDKILSANIDNLSSAIVSLARGEK